MNKLRVPFCLAQKSSCLAQCAETPTLDFCLNCSGLTPVFALNTRLKWFGFSKPHSKLISVTGSKVSSSKCFAFSSLFFINHLAGDSSKYFLNSLLKDDTLLQLSFA